MGGSKTAILAQVVHFYFGAVGHITIGGDIRAGSTKRAGFAVGDGSLAVTCAHRLLSIQR